MDTYSVAVMHVGPEKCSEVGFLSIRAKDISTAAFIAWEVLDSDKGLIPLDKDHWEALRIWAE